MFLFEIIRFYFHLQRNGQSVTVHDNRNCKTIVTSRWHMGLLNVYVSDPFTLFFVDKGFKTYFTLATQL